MYDKPTICVGYNGLNTMIVLSNDPVFNHACHFQVGNPTATVIALCALRDVSIELESSQLAILELSGIGILLNILKTDHWPCVVRFFSLNFTYIFTKCNPVGPLLRVFRYLLLYISTLRFGWFLL